MTALSFADQMVQELNLARKSPRGYAQIVASYPGVSQQDRNETIQFLNQAGACTNTLSLDPGLTQVSDDWVRVQGATGGTGHGNFLERFRRVGTYMAIAENLAYGNQTARDAVVQWIIDAGIQGKGHRVNIYNCFYDQVGVAQGSHNSIYRQMISTTFGRGFQAYS